MSPPSVLISKRLQRQGMSRTLPQVKRRQLFMNPWFVSPLADGWCVFFNVLLLWTVQTENRRRKSIFQMSLGEWVSLTSLACLSFCFLLCLSLSHLPLWVLTLSLSLEFCSRCALTLIPPLKPTIISLSLLFVSLSLPLFLTFLNLSFPPSPPLSVPWDLCRYGCVMAKACGSALPQPTLIHAS